MSFLFFLFWVFVVTPSKAYDHDSFKLDITDFPLFGARELTKMDQYRGTGGGGGHLPFVTGAIWYQPRGMMVQVRVREKLRKDPPPSGSSGGKCSTAAAKKLTSQTKKKTKKKRRKNLPRSGVSGQEKKAAAGESERIYYQRVRVIPLISKIKQGMNSAAGLLDLLDGVMDGPIWMNRNVNASHVSAAYHSLATWKRKGGLTPSDKASPVLPRLAASMQNLTEDGEVEPREVSNVLCSLGQLSDDLDIPEGLLMALVKWLGEKASGMDPQELSNSLLAFVQLKGVAPEVLTALPELAAQVSIKAKDMIPQHISNSLWVATRLKDDTPEVLQMVPALVEEIPRNQADFSPREICHCLEALILLQDSVPEVGSVLGAPPDSKNDFLGFAARRFSTLPPTLTGKVLLLEIPLVVWACARVNFYDEELLDSVARGFPKSGSTYQKLTDWNLCTMLWSYDVLTSAIDARLASVKFKKTLESERLRRNLSDSDVSKGQMGYFEWNQGQGLRDLKVKLKSHA